MEKTRTKVTELDENLKVLLSKPTYKFGAFTFDVAKRELAFQNELTELTKKETYLLVLFAANANKLMERRYMLKTIWHDDSYFAGRTMDVYICKLRKLLNKDSKINIVNSHGEGYKLLVNHIDLG